MDNAITHQQTDILVKRLKKMVRIGYRWLFSWRETATGLENELTYHPGN
jgi:hypothetical protein